jgi:hypothetical protein
MTATTSPRSGDFFYFTTNQPYGSKWCNLHGSYYGTLCPSCSTMIPAYPQTITPAPVSTEEALAATVTVLTNLISSLQEQLAERDRRIKELEDDARDSFNGR